ncbi:hypothetical protein BT69DRAFT_1291541 [Atractiella rhizophila]|nr:hypothetical protein BT69DRAFT_1291541 [Atractiella rhizophila]
MRRCTGYVTLQLYTRMIPRSLERCQFIPRKKAAREQRSRKFSATLFVVVINISYSQPFNSVLHP